jgi:hypothetical protein
MDKDTVRRVSHSEMKVFLRCRRKWYLSEFRGLGPKGNDPTGPLKSGSRVHTALEAFYTPGGGNPLDALKAAQDEDWAAYVRVLVAEGEVPDQGTTEAFNKDCDLERIMVEGYGEWIAESGEDADLEFIDTEKVVSVEGERVFPFLARRYGKPFEIVGKLDARVRRRMDGKRLFVDHKTAQSVTMALPMLQTDPQMLHYHWLESWTTDGAWTDGAIYNVLKKVKRTKAAKPPFYARYEIHHNDREIESYEARLHEIISDIFRMEAVLEHASPGTAGLIAYPNSTRDCSWDCQFFTLCPMFDDGSRVEHAIRDGYRERDPLARYQDPPPKGV